jgi:hypothetical protein
MDKELIVKEIEKQQGADESTSIELWADPSTGETKIVVEKTIREYYKLTDYDKAKELYKGLTRAGGRIVPKLRDLQ